LTDCLLAGDREGTGWNALSQGSGRRRQGASLHLKKSVGVVEMFSGTCFLAVGLLVASVPVVRVVRVFAMGHEEMKVASGETYRAKRHDADTDYCASYARQKAFPHGRSLIVLVYRTNAMPFNRFSEHRPQLSGCVTHDRSNCSTPLLLSIARLQDRPRSPGSFTTTPHAPKNRKREGTTISQFLNLT